MALGSPLAVLGGVALMLVPLLGWTAILGPWSFAIGLLVGITAGVGVTLTLTGLFERRRENG